MPKTPNEDDGLTPEELHKKYTGDVDAFDPKVARRIQQQGDWRDRADQRGAPISKSEDDKGRG